MLPLLVLFSLFSGTHADYVIDDANTSPPNGPVYSGGPGNKPWYSATSYPGIFGNETLPESDSPTYNHTLYVHNVPRKCKQNTHFTHPQKM